MIRKRKPTSPGQRQTSGIIYRQELSTSKPHKALTRGRKRAQGRNSAGRITTRHKGGGHKRRWREIDFKYNKVNIPAKVETVEYDPNRSGFIGLALYADGERRYVLLPAKVKVGQSFLVSETAEVAPGNRLPLKKVPVGASVFNVEVQPGGGAKLVRSAGVFAELLSRDGGYVNLKLPSNEVRQLPENCWATIGAVAGEEHKLVSLGKAGRSRWLGIRPTVRGSAMNPVDHRHGGGEGRQGIGLRRGPVTPWGKQARGVRTRRAKKYSNRSRVSRRIKK
jgi:large subunit ribosomal protein L2